MDKSNGTQYPDPSTTSVGENALLRGVSQAGSTLHETIDKVADPARSTVDRAATVAHNTVDKLTSGASSVAGKVSDQAHRLSDAPLQAVDYSKAYIKQHPLQAVGAALLIGLVIGRLTASRY
ncbi:YqjD family protein [Polaromonas sp. UC242_47]|uniref:YqjD family protein n=1 Tax=Polaromonas sp. UC242_47 TaxID=3374626 RepID=UPI003790794E